MATKNAILSNDPIEVAFGGVGASTLTDHGLLVGSGTNAITTLSVGTTGQLLVGSSSSDPAFGASATGDFTFTSSTASETRVLTVTNTDNTSSATSAARLDVSVGGSNVGDAQLNYNVTGETIWSTGIDTSDPGDSDRYKLSQGAVIGTNDIFTATIDGNVTKELQPAFLAKRTTGDNNVTGDGTIYSYVANVELFDQSGDYSTSTGQFTAPVSGRYLITSYVRFSGTTGDTEGTVYINTSNRRYSSAEIIGAASGDIERHCTSLVDMDAADVAYPQAMSDGAAAKTTDVFGDSTDILRTGFSGYLVC